VHAKRLDKTPAASVRGDPGAGKTALLDHLAAGGSSLSNRSRAALRSARAQAGRDREVPSYRK